MSKLHIYVRVKRTHPGKIAWLKQCTRIGYAIIIASSRSYLSTRLHGFQMPSCFFPLSLYLHNFCTAVHCTHRMCLCIHTFRLFLRMLFCCCCALSPSISSHIACSLFLTSFLYLVRRFDFYASCGLFSALFSLWAHTFNFQMNGIRFLV